MFLLQRRIGNFTPHSYIILGSQSLEIHPLSFTKHARNITPKFTTLQAFSILLTVMISGGGWGRGASPPREVFHAILQIPLPAKKPPRFPSCPRSISLIWGFFSQSGVVNFNWGLAHGFYQNHSKCFLNENIIWKNKLSFSLRHFLLLLLLLLLIQLFKFSLIINIPKFNFCSRGSSNNGHNRITQSLQLSQNSKACPR